MEGTKLLEKLRIRITAKKLLKHWRFTWVWPGPAGPQVGGHHLVQGLFQPFHSRLRLLQLRVETFQISTIQLTIQFGWRSAIIYGKWIQIHSTVFESKIVSSLAGVINTATLDISEFWEKIQMMRRKSITMGNDSREETLSKSCLLVLSQLCLTAT